MTTYCGISDLDSLLEGFVARYYGTYLDDGEDLTVGTQFNIDQYISFNESNEWLSGIGHIKQIPVGTQPTSGNYPLHVRMLQANLMIYNRLKGKHYGEFTQGIPGWINVYSNRARDILSDIKGQNVVFETDVYQGESGIGIGSFDSKAGSANWYTNWETGVYQASDFPRTYVIQIDGTTDGNQIGSATFKFSNDGGVSWATTNQDTDTKWIGLENGLNIRFETVGTGTLQLGYGDRFSVRCIPLNIGVKSGNIRYVTFMRG